MVKFRKEILFLFYFINIYIYKQQYFVLTFINAHIKVVLVRGKDSAPTFTVSNPVNVYCYQLDRI